MDKNPFEWYVFSMNTRILVYVKKTYGGEYSSKRLIMDVFRLKSDEYIAYSPTGKPYLTKGDFFISPSHSENFFVLGVAKINIGVDIERADRLLSDRTIERVFNDEEKEFIRFNPAPNGIFMWTRLEAALKLTGTGLSGIDGRTFMLYDEDEKIKDPICYSTVRYGDMLISAAAYEPIEAEIMNI